MDGQDPFCSWLEFGFNEGIMKRNVRKPVLLLNDRARCHISIDTSEFCVTNDIILYILYPNTTHLIQALDLVLMNIVKTTYEEEVWQWLIANPGEVFDKYVFIEVFMKVWDRAVKVEYAIRGFELSGIYLLNPAKYRQENWHLQVCTLSKINHQRLQMKVLQMNQKELSKLLMMPKFLMPMKLLHQCRLMVMEQRNEMNQNINKSSDSRYQGRL